MIHEDVFYRKAQIYQGGMWYETPFQEIKKGMTFRLFESDGTAIEDAGGSNHWVAATDALPDKNGIYYVSIE